MRIHALSITPNCLILADVSEVDISSDLILKMIVWLCGSQHDHKILLRVYQDYKTESCERIQENEPQQEEGSYLNQWFSYLSVHQVHLEVWLNQTLLGPTQRETVSLKWDLRTCISDKFTGSTDNAGTVTTL